MYFSFLLPSRYKATVTQLQSYRKTKMNLKSSLCVSAFHAALTSVLPPLLPGELNHSVQ